MQSPLLHNINGFVAGRWVGAGSGATLPVHNPATGEHLASVPDMGGSETTRAVEAAAAALKRPASIDQRREWLRAIASRLLDSKQELARIITLEQGKPLKESVIEVEYSAGFFSFFAGHLDQLASRDLPGPIRNMRWTIHHRPAGVVGLITPWNFPLAMLAKKFAPALAAGCGVVVKPADLTPLTAIALWNLLEPLEIPRGVLNLVVGRPAPIGEVLCTHPDVRLISFTGSTATGRFLLEKTAPYIKRLALELGGNAPYIVLDDADPIAAADALMPNKFRCAGQTCVCANRIYVHRDIEWAFVDAISQRVAKLRVGDGLEPQTDVGPLINRAAFEKVARHVDDAIKQGAARTVGNDPKAPEHDWGAFYPPTVLKNIHSQMQISQEETFGPVVAVETFASDDEAVAKANGTPYGLAAYLFTRDSKRADALLPRLQFGHVGVNTGTGPTPEAPFGGTKQSGFGREGGIEGLLEFIELQTVVSP